MDHEISNTPFHVIGICDEDGSATVLHEATNSGEAREWFNNYICNGSDKQDVWNILEVIDTRDECAATIWRWNRQYPWNARLVVQK